MSEERCPCCNSNVKGVRRIIEDNYVNGNNLRTSRVVRHSCTDLWHSEAAASSAEKAPQTDEPIPFSPAPCGHSSQYCYTENGGKNIICLLCEYKAAPQNEDWIRRAAEGINKWLGVFWREEFTPEVVEIIRKEYYAAQREP